MAEVTGISWCDHTHNAWIGCTAVSPGCDRCYAAARAARWGEDFAIRRRTAPANWRKPLAWDRKAAAAGVRRRVFCSSLADVFDNQVDPSWRADLWELIRACPALDWLLLTKRPQNIAKMLPADWGRGWPNVWLGTTVEDQTEANRRIPHLLAVPAVVRFLSCEPLLGLVDLHTLTVRSGFLDALNGRLWIAPNTIEHKPRVDWVIVGGESGAGARPMQRAWADALLNQCVAAGVAAFFKQTGSSRGADWSPGISGKGDDPLQWPLPFRVQQFPQPIEIAHAR